MSRKNKQQRTLKIICAALLGATASLISLNLQAQESSPYLNQLLKANSSSKTIRLSPVREAALKSSAQMLGAQTGLAEQSERIREAIEKRRVEMEKRFRFGDLVIGQGVLPPVLLHTENAESIEDGALRLAGAIYEIKEPARFFSGAPSWRDWLLMGLPEKDALPELPNHEQLLPRDSEEKAFWQQEMLKFYNEGLVQAQEIFDHNLSKLEQTYTGMRVFYDLYQRDMVSAPVIASSQEIVTRKDANTIVVGDTLFRITLPAEFNLDSSQWKALAARPSFVPPIQGVEMFDPEQIAHAYNVYKEQHMRKNIQRKAKQMGVKDTQVKTPESIASESPNHQQQAQTMAISLN